MKIIYDESLFNRHTPTLPSKLNIKLARSLNCLNIPLETFIGFNGISSSQSRISMVGSVDLISEIQQKSNCEIPPSSINVQSIVDEQQLPLKYRLPNTNDSVVRLRRSGRLQNIHQLSSSQIINDRPQRRQRRNGLIPKFFSRPLPSVPRRPSTVSRTSPFTSLPEIRLFVERSCIEERRSVIEKLNPLRSTSSSCWKKSNSWSWKSNSDIESNRINSNILNKFPSKVDDQINNDLFRPNLPSIIESPIQRHFPFRSPKCFPHSVSNYEMSSVPLLAHFDHEFTPLATFDEKSCSNSSSTSSFRSCIDSMDSFESSVESDSHEISIDYNKIHNPMMNINKHSRFSFRDACSIQ